MKRSKLRPVLAGLVVIVTISVFVYYVKGHPEIIRQFRKLPIATIGLLIGLYVVFMGTLAWIQRETIRLCEITLGRRESLLLTLYSSIINFFGPLQSGPAFRAAYLKKKHNVNLKKFAVASLLYYGFFAAFSLVFIATYVIGFWGLIPVIVGFALLPLLVRRPTLLPAKFRELKLKHIINLASATLAQVVVVAIIFYTELNSLGHHVAAIPTLIYTGAANFALFVSITPGAIGFRETFLYFTQQLHHIPSQQIVTASLIDRGIYVLILGIAALLVFGLHAQKRLTQVVDPDADSRSHH